MTKEKKVDRKPNPKARQLAKKIAQGCEIKVEYEFSSDAYLGHGFGPFSTAYGEGRNRQSCYKSVERAISGHILIMLEEAFENAN